MRQVVCSLAGYDPFRIRFLTNCVSEPAILDLWNMKEEERWKETRLTAAMHGIRISDEEVSMDKNEINKRAAMQIFGSGGVIRKK